MWTAAGSRRTRPLNRVRKKRRGSRRLRQKGGNLPEAAAGAVPGKRPAAGWKRRKRNCRKFSRATYRTSEGQEKRRSCARMEAAAESWSEERQREYGGVRKVRQCAKQRRGRSTRRSGKIPETFERAERERVSAGGRLQCDLRLGGAEASGGSQSGRCPGQAPGCAVQLPGLGKAVR